mmetsp:Transcript_107638/g.270001  ORF Transcript_107638/g.270001 Transcript_107638/m.270001 type:complete len:540 (-) Transcript_107638:338-1957(-)
MLTIRGLFSVGLNLAVATSVSGHSIENTHGFCHAGSCSNENILLQRGRSTTVLAPPVIDAFETRRAQKIVQIPCTIRDFRHDHADFYLPEEGPPGRSFGHVKGCVKQQLGPDRKPVFHENGTCFNSSASFAQWYNDAPGVNIHDNFTMEFLPNEFGGLTYDNPAFFPFDGKAWGNETFEHNYWFTMEMHVDFVYVPGSTFAFKGDDDVWVFVNGSLVMDLGGVHTPLDGALSLDDLHLIPGEKATLDFFFAERQPVLSTFKIDMRLKLDDAPLPMPERTCMIWGDPHVNVFDSVDPDGDAIGASVVNIYGHGDYWIVRSRAISIQGRYNATQWSIDGQSATRAIAIGGRFMRGHTLIIEAMDGQMTWDGDAILQDFPSSFAAEGLISASYHELEEPIDKAETHRPIYGVKLDLPHSVRVTVNRWAKHLDVLISMRPQRGGQDGHCGNLNFNATDDTLESISARMNLRVSAQDSLFPVDSLDTAEVTEKSIADCAPEIREQAQAHCEQMQVNGDGEAASEPFIKACVYDACFGGEDFAAQ